MAGNVPGNAKTVPAQLRMFANAGLDPRCVGPKYANFFALNYDPAAKMAAQYGTDPALPLGLSAFESGWAKSRMMQEQNNPHGATPDGAKGVSYPSVPAAWESWGRQWGPRIQGAGEDAPLFIQKLQEDNRQKPNAVNRRGAYNSAHPAQWAKGVADGVIGVRRRLADWRKYGC